LISHDKHCCHWLQETLACTEPTHDGVCWDVCLQDEFDDRRHYIKPSATGATQGHALGAQRTMAAVAASSSGSSKQWKMKRFESKAQSRIVQYMYSKGSNEEQEQQEAEPVAEPRDQQQE
jgi:hypothetical protein